MADHFSAQMAGVRLLDKLPFNTERGEVGLINKHIEHGWLMDEEPVSTIGLFTL
jgi:hypothetical protein